MSNDLPNRRSIRLRGYDYSQNGLYFVTICTHNRNNLFGEIVGATRGSPDGNNKTDKNINRAGHAPPLHMKLNKNGQIVTKIWRSLPKHHFAKLNVFQIMPNHVHFIIELTGKSRLGTIIGFFKSESTKLIRKSVGATRGSPDKIKPIIWQRNYFEHIIRDRLEYDKICYYIIHNPELWDRDRNNL